jgi:hypothetical protein
MKLQGTREKDPSLAGFLEASTESESDRLLEDRISGYALPIVRKIIRSKLRDALDPPTEATRIRKHWGSFPMFKPLWFTNYAD